MRLLVILSSFATVSLAAAPIEWEVTAQWGLPANPYWVAGSPDGYAMVTNTNALYISENGLDWELQEVDGELVRRSSLAGWKGNWLVPTKEEGVLYVKHAGADALVPHQTGISGYIHTIVPGENEVLVIGNGEIRVSSDLRNWTPVETGLSGVGASAVYGNGIYVVCSTDNSDLAVSPDGIEWAIVHFGGSTKPFRNLMHNSGRWMAQLNDSQGDWLLSEDALHWDLVDESFDVTNHAVAGGFFILSSGDSYSISSDGSNWETFYTDSSASTDPDQSFSHPRLVGGPNGVFMFQETNRDGCLAHLDETGDWSLVDNYPKPNPVYSDYHFSTNYTGGRFFYSNSNGDTVMNLTSSDGFQWDAIDPTAIYEAQGEERPESLTFDWIENSAFGNGNWVLTSGKQALVSDTGSDWLIKELTITDLEDWTGLRSMCFFDGRFYALAWKQNTYDAQIVALVASPDGLAWEKLPLEVGGWDKFGALGAGEDGILLATKPDQEGAANTGDFWSEDGVEWTPVDNLAETCRICVVDGEFILEQPEGGTVLTWTAAKGLQQKQFGGMDRNDKIVYQMTKHDSNFFVVSRQGEVYVGAYASDLVHSYAPIDVKRIVAGDAVAVGFGYRGIVTTVIDREAYIWHRSAHYLNGWVESAWYGWLFDGTFPWVYHATQGWQYQVVDGNGNLAFYDHALRKWIWTNSEFFPYVYIFDGDSSAWLYYEIESETPDRWFYDYKINDWRHEPDMYPSE